MKGRKRSVGKGARLESHVQQTCIAMKLPKHHGSQASSTIFHLVCFVVGLAIVTVFSLGKAEYDDREGPGWNPIARLPNGKIGISEFAIGSIGFAALAIGLAAFPALGLLVNHIRLS